MGAVLYSLFSFVMIAWLAKSDEFQGEYKSSAVTVIVLLIVLYFIGLAATVVSNN